MLSENLIIWGYRYPRYHCTWFLRNISCYLLLLFFFPRALFPWRTWTRDRWRCSCAAFWRGKAMAMASVGSHSTSTKGVKPAHHQHHQRDVNPIYSRCPSSPPLLSYSTSCLDKRVCLHLQRNQYNLIPIDFYWLNFGSALTEFISVSACTLNTIYFSPFHLSSLRINAW